ncbi:MAG: XRE family transcriptional regulator [Erysipelotrichaceae bacterium]|nr:XRE family transcriptional regulator [Erysipelotrichaceae bacterium]
MISNNLNLYYIKHFDEVVLSFEYETDDYLLEGSVKNINIKNDELIPCYLKSLGVNNNTLLSWLKSRSIPKNRQFVKKLLYSMNLKEGDTRGILDITKGLSLNDVYWVCSDYENDILKYDDINLYDNDFSEALSLVAFTGVETKIKELCSSPEFTTTGTLPKCWRRIEKQTYLFKGGTEGFANAGKEPYMEYYASQILEQLEYSYVPYDLTRWKGILASTCPIFTSKDVSYVPMGYIVPEGGIKAVNDYLKTLSNQNIYHKFQQYILFTAIISNNDSHYGNFGLLQDNHTNEFIDFAPIFDNGGGLFCYAMMDELENLNKLRKYEQSLSISYFGMEYTNLVMGICDPSMTKDLAKLHNFMFHKHSHYNLSDKALNNLNIIISERIQKFEKALMSVEVK